MNTARWIQSLVVARPDLYRAVYDWNAYPHRWALPAWLADMALPAPVVALLESTSAGRQRLSRHFSRALGLEETWWDFQEPRRRLALLSAEGLARLAQFAGAAMHASRLARVVTKDERRALTSRIGEQAYAFGMRKNRLLVVAASESTASDLAGTVEQTGWEMVTACLRDQPPAIRTRLRLKTPPAFADATGSAVDDAEKAWDFLRPITVEALRPEELRCLA